MARASRLFDLLHLLHRQSGVVSGRHLAGELGISLRTLYRDIATLQAMGADVEGGAGVGYRLKPGFMLPPMSFPVEEVEALVLGARWVAERADPAMGQAARSAAARIMRAMTAEQADAMRDTALFIGSCSETYEAEVDPAPLRAAIRAERRLLLVYRDATGETSERMIWPMAIALFDRADVLLGWCELRSAYRTFRIDRIVTARTMPERYPRRRAVMLREWREAEGIPQERFLLTETDAGVG
ncbi:YafY family protein [Sphingomonas parapaucimobilis]|jgi:predicted DNA-binding transcriptional regulator YafY|uniref:Putative transcriptional regulator n=1 Tax=Sphingomonas parapaucimobilis NBRC 15100 TaxID=1219049 RepID=A0A0A1W335_9SPHN|nr:YafY family protein [Sphingomonas parapaucimobilis]GAL99626.1 putative transcriptional regulator [Sphingomonas parapaucimobilis NBRC 15100]